MKMKNDCQADYIKEAFDKLYNCVMPFIDLAHLDDAASAFKELDKKLHSEIYILKKRLAERDRAVDAGLTRSEVDRERISDLESENNAKQHVIESFVAKVNDLEKKIRHLEIENANLRVTPDDANAIEVLKRENRVLRCDNKKLAAACEENNHLREVIDGKEKEINDLKKKIHKLEQEAADDAIRIKSLERANSVLRGDNKQYKNEIHELEEENTNLRMPPDDANSIEVLRGENEMLWSRIEEVEKENRERKTRNETLENVISALKRRHEMLYSKIEVLKNGKRPWHGDGNATTGAWTCCESLFETIEFQSKKIKELEAEKTRLKLLLTQQNEIDALKKENSKLRTLKEDLSYGHEFEFGDEVFVSWSCDPYMYIKSGQLYNPRTERLVYVGKDQHLKWFGEKFSIV